jgi:gluconate 2-dehydrogenase gamma chain
MTDDLLNRRGFLGAACTVIGAGWFVSRPAEVYHSLERAVRARALHPPVWGCLTIEQAADVDAIVSMIMPSDDTPGAHEAGVVHFIDQALVSWNLQQRQPLLAGLVDLNRQAGEVWAGAGRFASLSSDQQAVLLKGVEQTPFFQTMRFFTMFGMFALPRYGGNVDKVGWRLIGFDDRYTWAPPFGDYDAEATHRDNN